MTRYGLPEQVVFCKRCVLSNQRPSSRPEHKHTPGQAATYMHIDEDGVCDACRQAEAKAAIDWDARRAELAALCDLHRRDDGRYDCIVPGSGGKDSVVAAWVLKHEFGMHPLTCTWPPLLYTDYGRRNFERWAAHFDNVTVKPAGRTHATLTRLAIENLLHPFQPFILGQKNLAPKVAVDYDVPLVFYGENEAEYGNPIALNTTALRDRAIYTYDHLDDVYLGGVSIGALIVEHGLELSDLSLYLPAEPAALDRVGVEVRYLGYYGMPLSDGTWGGWDPQEAFYLAADKVGFEARPFRTEGTYSRYNSIDDKVDDLHYFTTYQKYGLGRASYDASQEVRNGHIDRDEAIALVARFDGETPRRYLDECLDYIGMSDERFFELCRNARPDHLFDTDGKLLHPVWQG